MNNPSTSHGITRSGDFMPYVPEWEKRLLEESQASGDTALDRIGPESSLPMADASTQAEPIAVL